MLTSRLIRQLIALTLVIAVPSFGCFGWYSLGTENHSSAWTQMLVVIAYPASLISAGLWILNITSATPKRRNLWISALSLLVMVSIILLTRSHLLVN